MVRPSCFFPPLTSSFSTVSLDTVEPDDEEEEESSMLYFLAISFESGFSPPVFPVRAAVPRLVLAAGVKVEGCFFETNVITAAVWVVVVVDGEEDPAVALALAGWSRAVVEELGEDSMM